MKFKIQIHPHHILPPKNRKVLLSQNPQVPHRLETTTHPTSLPMLFLFSIICHCRSAFTFITIEILKLFFFFATLPSKFSGESQYDYLHWFRVCRNIGLDNFEFFGKLTRDSDFMLKAAESRILCLVFASPYLKESRCFMERVLQINPRGCGSFASGALQYDEDFMMKVFDLDPQTLIYGLRRWCSRFGDTIMLRSRNLAESMLQAHLDCFGNTYFFQKLYRRLTKKLVQYESFIVFAGGISHWSSQSPLRLLDLDTETSFAIKKKIFEYVDSPMLESVDRIRTGVINLKLALEKVQKSNKFDYIAHREWRNYVLEAAARRAAKQPVSLWHYAVPFCTPKPQHIVKNYSIVVYDEGKYNWRTEGRRNYKAWWSTRSAKK